MVGAPARFGFLLVLLATLPGLFQAQQVTVRLHEPRPGQAGIEDMWWVDINNSTTETFRGVWLYGEIHRLDQGLVFHARSNSFDLLPGRRTIRLRDIRIQDPWYKPGFDVFYRRAGTIPEGRYIYEVRLEPELGSGSVGFEVTLPNQPRLISPPDGASIRGTRRYPFFAWTGGALPRDAGFELRVVEVLRGQAAEEALAANPPWFERSGLRMTSLLYPVRARALELERLYAWQVRVISGRRELATSEAWSFRYGAPETPPESIPRGLPRHLAVGGFTLGVLSYAPGANLGNLAGRARGFFEHGSSPVPFDVDFAGLATNWEPGQGETAAVTTGIIKHTFGRALGLTFARAGVRARVFELELASDLARATVSFELHKSLADSSGSEPAVIGPLTVSVNPEFDVLESLPALDYGPFLFKEPAMPFQGRGVTIDLSPTRPSTSLFWEGIVLDSAKTRSSPSGDTVNVGFLHASYRFTGATVDSSGLDAKLVLDSAYTYTTLVPLGFTVGLLNGNLKVNSSRVDTGGFDAAVLLPGSVSWGKNQPVQLRANLAVDRRLNLRSDSVPVNQLVALGEYYQVHVTDGALFFPADPYPAAMPDFSSPSYQRDVVATQLLTAPLPGMTFSDARNRLQTMWIRSRDVGANETLSVPVLEGWLNIGTGGAFGDMGSREGANSSCWLGRPGTPGYKADTVFFTDFRDSIEVVLVDNAVYDAWFEGFFRIPFPTDCRVPFSGLGFTSVGEAVGGRPVFEDTLELKYWGVGITSKWGVVSVRTGEIIYTSAEIIEQRHFTQGFRIYWGEMLADGDLGRFHFDYNSGNQKFDTIPFTIHAAGLSPYKGDTTGDYWGYLKVSGDLSFPFWGSQFDTIYDYKYAHKNHYQDPWNSRYVKLSPAQFALSRNWGSGTARLDFPAVRYDTADQDAFQATGTVEILRGLTGKIPAQMDLNTGGSLIGFVSATKGGSGGGSGTGNTLLTGAGGGVKLGPISGFVVIPGDQLERIYVDGPIEMSASEGWAGIGARVQFNGAVTAEITPTSFAIGAMAGMSVNFSSVASVDAMCSAKFLFADTCFKGDVFAVFNTSPIQIGGEGQFSIYVGFPGATRPPAFYFQGAAKCWLYYFGRGLSAEGAVVLAMNAPNSELWALGKVGRNVTARSLLDAVVPTDTRLTGFYGGGKFGGSLSLAGIISGGYWVWGGAGCFYVPDQTKFVALANAGILVHGDVLGFLASADLWAELGGAAAPPDFALQGACGFEVAVLFFSYSWDGTISIGTGGIDAW
jgi:hypothetical protein